MSGSVATSLQAALDAPEEVRVLDLSADPVTALPAEVILLSSLETLVLDGRTLESLPEEISSLPRLREVRLRRSGGLSVIRSLRQIGGLRVLDLSGSRLAERYGQSAGDFEALEALSGLETLEELYLDEMGLAQVPPGLGRLRNLRVLSLRRNALGNLPDELGLLVGLERLHLDDNALVAIPEAVRKLARLKELTVSGNPLLGTDRQLREEVRVPDRWLRRALGIEDGRKTKFPRSALARIDQVEWSEHQAEAGLPFGLIKSLEGLQHCPRLRRLSLLGHAVQSLEPLRSLAALEELWLPNGDLRDIGALEGKTKLRVAVLDGNPALADLVALRGLPALERLNVARTKVSDIAVLASLPALREVTLDATPLDLSPGTPSLGLLEDLRRRQVVVRATGCGTGREDHG